MMSENQTAFPTSGHEPGMTKREYIATHMLIMLANRADSELMMKDGPGQIKGAARAAVAFADALLEELEA